MPTCFAYPANVAVRVLAVDRGATSSGFRLSFVAATAAAFGVDPLDPFESLEVYQMVREMMIEPRTSAAGERKYVHVDC